MAKTVKLKARRLIWMGDDRPLVKRGESFATDAEAAKKLVDKGQAVRVRTRRKAKEKDKE